MIGMESFVLGVRDLCRGYPKPAADAANQTRCAEEAEALRPPGEKTDFLT